MSGDPTERGLERVNRTNGVLKYIMQYNTLFNITSIRTVKCLWKLHLLLHVKGKFIIKLFSWRMMDSKGMLINVANLACNLYFSRLLYE